MLVNCGEYDNAITELQRALSIDPNCTNAHTQLCWVLRTRGQVMDAIRHGEQALAADGNEVAGFYLIFAYLAADEYAQALRACDRLLERNPRSVRALALRVSALNGVNRRDEACVLADFDSITWAAIVPTPAGYPNITRFNAELVKLVEQYPGRPHDATQTLNLFDRPEPVARALADTIHSAVQRYLSTVTLAAAHPFLAQKPHDFTAEAWGTRLNTYGEAEHHFHQHAWISGVYYVDLPEFVQNPKANSLDGCLEFCRFHSYSATPVQSDTMVIQPEPGLIVLFPAYAYHRVLPFERPGRRISIAFNLLPSE